MEQVLKDRVVYVLSGGLFVRTEFANIKAGDTFRMYEPSTGKRVYSADKKTFTFVAVTDAQPDGSIIVEA